MAKRSIRKVRHQKKVASFKELVRAGMEKKNPTTEQLVVTDSNK